MRMLSRRSVLCAAVGATFWPHYYPLRLIKIVVDRPAGSPHDLLTRALAQKLSDKLKQTFIVENKAGAGGVLAAEFVARSAADGYTLLVALDTTLTVNPTLYKNIGFDPDSQLRPVSIMAMSSSMLVVRPTISVGTVREFVAFAKTHAITYAHGGNGSPGHLAMEYFRLQAGFPATPVPYRGNPQAVLALLAGQVDAGFVGTAGVIAHVSAGRLKALAISAVARSPLAPGVPTMTEAGYPHFKAEVYYVMLAPAGTKDSIVDFLGREIRVCLSEPDIRARFGKLGMSIRPTNGEVAADRLRSDRKLWAGVIQAAHMQAN